MTSRSCWTMVSAPQESLHCSRCMHLYWILQLGIPVNVPRLHTCTVSCSGNVHHSEDSSYTVYARHALSTLGVSLVPSAAADNVLLLQVTDGRQRSQRI